MELLPWIKNHPNHALYGNMEDMVCPTCGSKNLQRNGTRTTKQGIYARYHCGDCGSWPRGRYMEKALTKEQKEAILT